MVDLVGIGVDDLADVVELADLLSCSQTYIEHGLGGEGEDMRECSCCLTLADPSDDENMDAFVDGKGDFLLFLQPQSLDDWSRFRCRRAVDDHVIIISPLGSTAKSFWKFCDAIGRFRGKDLNDITIQYHKDFSITDIQKEFTILETLKELSYTNRTHKCLKLLKIISNNLGRGYGSYQARDRGWVERLKIMV